ncbi:hypothetical protein BJX99DRAFT_202245 [Aspergillus californicus]
MLAQGIAQLLFIGYTSAIAVGLTSIAGASSSYAVNADGSCFSLSGGTLQQYNDNLKSMSIPSGYQCVIWENYNCNGDHTYAFSGSPQIEDVCLAAYPFEVGHNWAKMASSFKCCPLGSWCAGSTPTCT